MPYSLLQKVYQEAKVYLNTSTGGIFPIEILEAMACGCVVITLPFPGIANFIENEVTGFICRDVSAIKRLIGQITKDKKMFTRIGEAAREFVVKNCDITKQAQMLNEEIIDSIKSKREKVYEGKLIAR
jgi:glycosyltransferase involved in cell wall biosynthesis